MLESVTWGDFDNAYLTNGCLYHYINKNISPFTSTRLARSRIFRFVLESECLRSWTMVRDLEKMYARGIFAMETFLWSKSPLGPHCWLLLVFLFSRTSKWVFVPYMNKHISPCTSTRRVPKFRSSSLGCIWTISFCSSIRMLEVVGHGPWPRTNLCSRDFCKGNILMVEEPFGAWLHVLMFTFMTLRRIWLLLVFLFSRT
jgi:hypothetical protein